MKVDPTIVEFNTESVEGPVTIQLDGRPVVKLDFKATPGLFHLVVPQRFRLKEVPHTSPELNEGIHHAVLHNDQFLENQRLESSLHSAQEEATRFRNLANAYAQSLPEGQLFVTQTPLLLEVWNEEESVWRALPWRDLKAGMRFRNMEPLSGEFVVSDQGHIDWMAVEDAVCAEDGNWRVESDPCETNYLARDPEGTLIEHPPVPKKKEDE
jgi:hypothetical protein